MSIVSAALAERSTLAAGLEELRRGVVRGIGDAPARFATARAKITAGEATNTPFAASGRKERRPAARSPRPDAEDAGRHRVRRVLFRCSRQLDMSNRPIPLVFEAVRHV